MKKDQINSRVMAYESGSNKFRWIASTMFNNEQIHLHSRVGAKEAVSGLFDLVEDIVAEMGTSHEPLYQKDFTYLRDVNAIVTIREDYWASSSVEIRYPQDKDGEYSLMYWEKDCTDIYPTVLAEVRKRKLFLKGIEKNKTLYAWKRVIAKREEQQAIILHDEKEKK